jgi:phage tail-like protein
MAGEGTGSDQDYPLPAFHFAVAFGGGGSGDDTSFQEVSGIGAELELEAVAEGGENRFVHQLPKAVKHPRLVLKRGIAKIDSSLVTWCKSVLEQDYSEAIETRDLEVRLLNEEREPVRSWSFVNAYPVNWDLEGFGSTKNEVAIEKIELAYSHSERTD